MKIKLISPVLLFLVFIILGVWFIKQKVGDFRPALLPPSKNITNLAEKQAVGDLVDFPLKLPDSFQIGVFAKGLNAPRDLEFSPGETLLVSTTSQGKVYALPDKNGDGRVDQTKEILTGLNKPHGLSFFGGKLFVAEESRVLRYNWNEQTLTATLDKKLFDLPAGGRHFTRSIAFGKGGQMFVSVGSTCDVCYEKHKFLAGVLVSDENGNNPRPFATGLRNSVFIAVNPQTDELWGTEMGRDFLGDNIPPDEINIIKKDGNYGWPQCYGDRIHDTNFDKNAYAQVFPPLPCSPTEAPVYEIPAHSAPLGLTFINSPQFPKDWQGDLLVSYHGSWNRSTPTGYKIVRMDVEGNTIKGESDFLTGFLKGSQALGRPVDLTFDDAGSLYISDDKAGVIYKLSKK